VPGGEITPEKLIVSRGRGEKFGLYTKITGAQRIDLFGARVEQLPLVWKGLVDAGFESGHAYWEALRTVKSCVRQHLVPLRSPGLVAMAIDIENRYRGIRLPHNEDWRFSGCSARVRRGPREGRGHHRHRERLESVRVRDGGMKPRHATSRTDLDDRTLIKYIDRFSCSTIRTGDRLQRTQVWLENLEGGIDYLRKVVCEDSSASRGARGGYAESGGHLRMRVEEGDQRSEIMKRFRIS